MVRDLLSVANAKKAVRNPRKAARTLSERLQWAYLALTTDDYTEYYLRKTKGDVEADPAAAVGPAELFEEMREWQIDFLVQQGLTSDDTVLDIGCGVLRGGIPIIEFLDDGNYYGIDISEESLDIAKSEIEEHGLEHKSPVLVHNSGLDFSEPAFDGITFDLVWAQSVVTHLPPEQVRILFEHLGSILSTGGEFYATYWEADGTDVERRRGTDFYYPDGTLRRIAAEHGLTMETVNCDHPNDLSAARFTAV